MSLRYRFSTDDNIHFLHDLTANSGKYRSIFENEYLAFWREMHSRYSAKFHLNIFFEEEGFDLTQVPSCFRSEWRENSDWLRLTFHARSFKPDKPYLNSGYEEVAEDFERVTNEIARFAGDELLAPVTTIHWCEITRDGCRALRKRGIEVISGLYRARNGMPELAAYLTIEQVKILDNQATWYDPELDLAHLKIQAMIEHDLPDEPNTVVRFLDRVSTISGQSKPIELLIHEYALTPSSPYYKPYARQRVVDVLEWFSAKGYSSVLHGPELAAEVREAWHKIATGIQVGR